MLVFLVLASGTGKDHATTAWSATGAATKLVLGWPAADAAIKRLIADGRLVSLVPEGKKASQRRPNYKLRLSDDHTRRIWLPMTLIEGTEQGELPPIQMLRQMGKIGPALALLQCYAHLDMSGSGGVDIAQACWTVDRRRMVTRVPACRVWEWGYNPTGHFADDFMRHQFDHGDLEGLESSGLLRWVHHLRDGGEDGATLAPYDSSENAEPIEREIAYKIDDLTHHHTKNIGDGNVRWVAMPAHISDPRLVLVARPRYLPHTKPVKAWACKLQDQRAAIHPFWGADAAKVAA